jgi:hypothetical protein
MTRGWFLRCILVPLLVFGTCACERHRNNPSQAEVCLYRDSTDISRGLSSRATLREAIAYLDGLGRPFNVYSSTERLLDKKGEFLKKYNELAPVTIMVTIEGRSSKSSLVGRDEIVSAKYGSDEKLIEISCRSVGIGP